MQSALDRLLSVTTDTLSIHDAAFVCELGKTSICRMIDANKLGALRFGARGDQRQLIKIPHVAMVCLLVRSAQGDARDLLMLEIKAKAPAWLPVAELELEKLKAATPPPVKSLKLKTPRARSTRPTGTRRIRVGEGQGSFSLF